MKTSLRSAFAEIEFGLVHFDTSVDFRLETILWVVVWKEGDRPNL